jgi:hypothetical protein
MGLGPLQNANTVPLNLNPGTLPDPSGSMLDYMEQLTVTQITKTVVNFQNVEVPVTTTFYGVIQELTPQQLMMKPSGQRQFTWRMIHTFPTVVLNPDDVVIYQGVQYRVMSKSDWTKCGYIQYDCMQDYTGSGP